jgi:ABC-type multidrug transport system fused ATPase/permease subunit
MKKQQKVIPIMWGYLKKYKIAIAVAMLSSAFAGICVALQPLIIKHIVDKGITNDALDNGQKLQLVLLMCGVYVLLAVVRVLTYRNGYRLLLKSVEGALRDLKSRVFDHVEHMGLRFHAEVSVGELHNCLNGTPITNIRGYLHSIILNVPYQVIAMIISLVALFGYDWVMTLVLLFTAILMALLNFFARKKIRKISAEQIQVEKKANHFLVDTLGGMEAVKMYGVEASFQSKFDHTLKDVHETMVKVNLANQKEAVKIEMANYIGVAVLYMVGAVSCIYRESTTGVLYAFLSSMTTILSTLSAWLSMGLSKVSAQSGMDAITRIINKEIDVPDIPAEFSKDVEKAYQTMERKQFSCVEFSDVEFAYDDLKIFDGFNCRLRPGESVALVGESGSGKSTFTKLLLRLYDVQEGSVRVFGNDVKDYAVRSLRSAFGVVPQNTTIFYGTVWDNIKLACPTATDDEILRAIDLAQMNDFKDSLENGWDTIVGDGARELSGGQRQRVGIARAVLGDPKILIFDEATSALDNVSERAVQTAMESLMKTHTVIVVAHRLSTIRNVDRILVFRHGQIVEEGTYDELAEKEDGFFREMLQ